MDVVDGHRVSAYLPESMLTWGEVEAVGERTLTAGAECSMETRVTLTRAIEPGLSIEVWTHFVSDLARAQVEHPDRSAWFACEGNGTEIERSANRCGGGPPRSKAGSGGNNGERQASAASVQESSQTEVILAPFASEGGGATVRARAYPDAKVHGAGSFFPYRRYAAAELPDGAASGDTIRFRFRDVSMQTYEETLFNLRFVVVASERHEIIGYIGDAFYRVVGGPPSSLRLVAPTCVECGEGFDCRIVVCDSYGNKTGEPLEDMAFEIETDSGPGSVSLGTVDYDEKRRLHVVRGMKCAGNGVYYLRACIKGAEPGITGMSNPIVVRGCWPKRIYWGDLHQHAYYCDGRGTPAANYEYAISTGCLDFCSVTPHEDATFAPPLTHTAAPPQDGWKEMVEAAERYNGGRFVTILGGEPGGLTRLACHLNDYYLETSNRPVPERLRGRWWEASEGTGGYDSYEQYVNELRRSKGDVLLLPHAHARGGPGVYDLPVLPDIQTSVEICSVHGVFEEFYREWLKHGHYVGVNGGGDNHMTSTGNGNPGYHYTNTNGLAAAHAPDLTRRGIWDAFKRRETYAVTGNRRIFLELLVNEEAMGTVVVGGAGPRTVRINVAGTAPLLRVDLYRNEKVVWTHRPTAASHDVLRLVWSDDWPSRRVDDSLTTGSIVLEGGRPAVLQLINAYTRTDAFTEKDGSMAYRSNAYSGTTRGLLAAVSGPAELLHFAIDDSHLGREVQKTTLNVNLADEHMRVVSPMRVPENHVKPLFRTEQHQPQFTLEADWVDLDWPKTADLEWRDEDESPAHYTVRVEQIDGNIAWSSPVWYLGKCPEHEMSNVVIR